MSENTPMPSSARFRSRGDAARELASEPGQGQGADELGAGDAERAPVAMEPSTAFAELGRISLSELTLAEVMNRVAELARATVPGADEVSVTLVNEGRASTVAFTGQIALHLDERQYEAGFGPCTDAAEGGAQINIADVATDARYPDFARAAALAGISSSLSLGMPLPQRTVGGLNLYARSAGAFDPDAVAVAQVFADYAAIALANANLLHASERTARQMEQAMATRAVIEQAKGILMARLGIDADAAFAHLARQSQEANRKLNDIAAELVRVASGGGES